METYIVETPLWFLVPVPGCCQCLFLLLEKKAGFGKKKRKERKGIFQVQVQYSHQKKSFVRMCAGELTCRENWRLSHGVWGRCVQEEAGINCKKQVQTYSNLFFKFFFVQHSIKIKHKYNLLSVGVSGREANAPVKCTPDTV